MDTIFSHTNSVVTKALVRVVVLGNSLNLYASILGRSGNFHEVVDNELYRSAQPSSTQLEKYVSDHDIRTVINLRGADSHAKWYRQEVETASRLSLNFIDFAMSSSSLLSNERADELVKLLKSAPKPILVHCTYGADRSGLVSVIYSSQIARRPHATAESQLSFYFGHFAVPLLSPSYAMDSSWEQLEAHFKDQPD